MAVPKQIPNVTDQQLWDEALSMLLLHNVIDLMKYYHYDPDDTTASDTQSVYNAVFNNKFGLMANPASDLHNLFKGFDSHWHNDDLNQVVHNYWGSSGEIQTKGTEVNYYYQGLLFRTFNFSLDTGLTWVQTWKTISRHGGITPGVDFFFRKGWKELPGMWPVVLRQYRNQQDNQARYLRPRKKH